MAKWYTESQLIGARGESLVEFQVLEMGHLYNRMDMDAGIDGEIEIRDPVTKEVTGQIIRVQSKATNGAFSKETDEGFEFTCPKEDLDYWLSANTPVLLVVSRPRTREAYWVCIQDHFNTAEKRANRKIWFNKEQDRFDSSASDQIIKLGRDRKAGLYINPVPKPETLYSNLLKVNRLPQKLYSAETPFHKSGQLIGKARDMDVWLKRAWALWNGRLWSVHDLSGPPWNHLCDTGTLETFDADEWAHSDNRDRRNLFIWVLKGCLEDFLWRRGVRFDRKMNHFHFMAPKDLRAKQISYRTHTGRLSPITVFDKYTYESGGKTRYYYRHHAFHYRFVYLGGEWYLRISPTYRYTWDGRNVDRFYESHLSGMKKIEKNRAVLSQVELWGHVLSSSDGMFDDSPLLGFGDLLTVRLPVGINDSVWKAKEDAERADSGVKTLFESKHREVENEE